MTSHRYGARPVTARSDLREVLEAVAAGRMNVAEALAALPLLQVEQVGEFARLDVGRALRKGVPEVVYAPGKSDEALTAIVLRLVWEQGLALASRVSPERAPALEAAVRSSAADAEAPVVGYDPRSGTFEAVAPWYVGPDAGGVVGVLTAGTSDISLAEEAALVARHMGCAVHRTFDVGVAGVHRLLEPLAEMIRAGVDALVVVAGMEGALPSVVAGMVDVPVIGVPAPTGYGLGGDGTAALYAMLQSCSPGVVVVNIGNGVGAGAAAGLIARRAHRASSGASDQNDRSG